MKRQTRATSIAATAHSLTNTTTKDLSRLPSLNFDTFTFSPKLKRISKNRQNPKPEYKQGNIVPIEVLEFKSARRRKKHRFSVFNEAEVLKMKKKLEGLLVETPEADFDCPSDDELIADTVKQKCKELKSALGKLKKVFR